MFYRWNSSESIVSFWSIYLIYFEHSPKSLILPFQTFIININAYILISTLFCKLPKMIKLKKVFNEVKKRFLPIQTVRWTCQAGPGLLQTTSSDMDRQISLFWYILKYCIFMVLIVNLLIKERVEMYTVFHQILYLRPAV